MATKSRGLGRGLDSLFAAEEDWGTGIREIPIGDLDPDPDQPRKTFNAEGIAELADSIRDQGVLQPLLVTATENGRYRIIAGERRFRACRQAGLETVPCIVRDMDLFARMEVSLIENLQREDLNPMEAALGINALMERCQYTQEQVSQRLGKSRSAVANLLRLLNLPEEIREMVRDGRLSAGHARALAALDSESEQLRLARLAVAQGLNVRQMEALAAGARKEQPKKPAPRPRDAAFGELQDKILSRTGLKSTLTGNLNKGKIVLQYSTREELEHFNELLDRFGE